MQRCKKLLIVFLGIFILLIVTLWLLAPVLHFYVINKVFNYVVQNFVNVTGMSTWLAKGLVIILLIPFVWALMEITKLNVRLFRKRKSYRTSNMPNMK